jgi:hypothetical protein
MFGDRHFWVDQAIDHGVAALFALACAFPALMLVGESGGAALVGAGLCALIGYAAARQALASLGAPRPRPLAFQPKALPTVEDWPELLLDRPAPARLEAVAEAVRAVSPPPSGRALDDQAALSDALERLRQRLA